MSILILKGSGTNVSADWATRSTGAGVIYATDFSSGADFVAQTKVYGQNDNPTYWRSLVTQDTSDPRLPSCLKITSPASTGCNGSAWYTVLNPGGFPGTATLGGAWTLESQGLKGIPFYVQLRLKAPSTRFTARNGEGWKFFDVSSYSLLDPEARSQSNTQFECVGQVQFGSEVDSLWNTPSSYHQPAYTNFYNDFTHYLNYYTLTRMDNGSGVADPPTRYGWVNASNNGTSAGNFRFTADTWITVDVYINMQTTDGTSGNAYKMWVTPQDGTSRTLLYDETSVYWGSDSVFTGGHNGLWLNAYETALSPPSGVDTYQKWGHVIASLNPIPLPMVGA